MTNVLLVLLIVLSLPGLFVAIASQPECQPDLFPARHRDITDDPTVPLPDVLIGASK